VGEAGTMTESIALAVQTRPDVVLMDVRLPDGSGSRLSADQGDNATSAS